MAQSEKIGNAKVKKFSGVFAENVKVEIHNYITSIMENAINTGNMTDGQMYSMSKVLNGILDNVTGIIDKHVSLVQQAKDITVN
jgi:hypothetical protein